jgi:hypothetical protein
MLSIGNPLDTALSGFRFWVISLEGFRNCTTPGILYQPYGVYAFGQNLHFENCAFSGDVISGTPTIGGVWTAGWANKFINNRYITVAQPAYVGVAGPNSTRDIEFNGMVMTGPTPFTYAVDVDPAAQEVRVICHADQRGTDTQFVNLMPATSQGYRMDDAEGIRTDHTIEARNLVSSPKFSMADDTIKVIDFGGTPTSGVLVIACQAESNSAALINFRVGSTPFCSSWAAGADVVTGTGALTDGTGDGTDLKFNVFAHTDGKLYLKNRRGGSARDYRVTLLSSTSAQITTTF